MKSEIILQPFSKKILIYYTIINKKSESLNFYMFLMTLKVQNHIYLSDMYI